MVNRGCCAGKNPTYDVHTSDVYCPLTGICELPVLPVSSFWKPGTRASEPEPFCTTCSIIVVICAAVWGLTTWRCGCRRTGLIWVPTRSTTCGGAYLPPLAITLTAASIWTMFTSMPCPNEEVAYIESAICEADGGGTKLSPATSIPLGCVRPNAWRFM